jgi:hypothetical protein
MSRMNGLMIIGVILLVAGLIGFAIPVFTTQKTEDVVRLGDVKIQSTQDVYHNIPPILSGGVLVLGVVLIGMGLYSKQ